MGEYAFAARLRDAVTSIAKTVIDRERPRYRYGIVASISRAENTCQVYFDNDPSAPVTVGMGSIQPSAAGQVVRVAGQIGDRYLDDVMGPSYQASGDDAWLVPTLLNGWVNYEAGWDTVGYRKDTEGFVHLTGLVQAGVANSVIFTLPPGYRPAAHRMFAAVSYDGFARIDVYFDTGNVKQSSGSVGFLSLNNISFLAEN